MSLPQKRGRRFSVYTGVVFFGFFFKIIGECARANLRDRTSEREREAPEHLRGASKVGAL